MYISKVALLFRCSQAITLHGQGLVTIHAVTK